jgi:hypothetical protein
VFHRKASIQSPDKMAPSPYTNTTANVRYVRLYECAVHAMRKKLNLSYDGEVSGSNTYKRGCGGAYVGV